MNRVVSWQQYGNHASTEECWVLIEGKVYDVSDFLVQHPGGDDILLQYKHSGLDVTTKFNAVHHSEYAKSLRNARLVGQIQSSEYPQNYVQNLKQKKKKYLQQTTLKDKHYQIISLSELSKHRSQTDCWIVVDGEVYDVTNYLQEHPGGVAKIMNEAGTDCTELFYSINHSSWALKKKNQFKIGFLQPQTVSNTNYFIVVLLIIGLAVMLITIY